MFLRNINFEAHKGDVIGILGHNGAGKNHLALDYDRPY